MDTGFSTSDAVLTSAMSGGFGNGNRGGQWGNQGGGMMFPGNSALAAEAHANGTAVKEAIDCNAIRVSDGMQRIADQAEEGRRQAQVTSLTDGMVNSEFRTSDRFAAAAKDTADAEFRSLDRQRDIERIINQNAKDAAECCCKVQLEACKAHAELMGEIKAVEGRGIERSLNAANAELTALRTQIACGCCNS